MNSYGHLFASNSHLALCSFLKKTPYPHEWWNFLMEEMQDIQIRDFRVKKTLKRPAIFLPHFLGILL